MKLTAQDGTDFKLSTRAQLKILFGLLGAVLAGSGGTAGLGALYPRTSSTAGTLETSPAFSGMAATLKEHEKTIQVNGERLTRIESTLPVELSNIRESVRRIEAWTERQDRRP